MNTATHRYTPQKFARATLICVHLCSSVVKTISAECGRALKLAPALLLAAPIAAFGAEPTQAQLDFFESRIRPIFANHCYECHSQESGKSKGGLLLDTRDAVLK